MDMWQARRVEPESTQCHGELDCDGGNSSFSVLLSPPWIPHLTAIAVKLHCMHFGAVNCFDHLPTMPTWSLAAPAIRGGTGRLQAPPGA